MGTIYLNVSNAGNAVGSRICNGHPDIAGLDRGDGGVGHGIGLDIHEYPSVGSKPIALKPGMVITVEPGLYFPTVGGVRIEDDVLIANDGCEILTSCDKTLELS